MNTPDILKDLIGGLYRESIGNLSFRFNKNNDNRIVAADGTPLGNITDRFDPNSIFNKYGSYGGKYSATSIFNKYGSYGGKYSQFSPFNKYTNTPPDLIINGVQVGKLTMNRYLSDSIPTDVFLFYALNELGLTGVLSEDIIESISDSIN